MLLSEHASIIRSRRRTVLPHHRRLLADAESYELARSSALLTVPVLPARWRRREQRQGCGWDDRIRGAKVSLLRWSSSSDPFCTDRSALT